MQTLTEQIKVLINLHFLFDTLDIHENKQIILAADFNLFLDTTLEVTEAVVWRCSVEKVFLEI